MLKISDGDYDSYGTKLKSHTISVDGNSLTLKLTTEDTDIIYKISEDTREPDISQIERFISSELCEAYAGKKPFTVSEYLQRMYIYIGDIDLGECRQFTASKVL